MRRASPRRRSPSSRRWSRARALLLTNDTGPRQIAVALGRPAVVLMGPTDPRHTAHHLERQRVLREDGRLQPLPPPHLPDRSPLHDAARARARAGGGRGAARVTARVVPDSRELAPLLERARARGARVALTNGCFDVLHVGHLRLLRDARCAGRPAGGRAQRRRLGARQQGRRAGRWCRWPSGWSCSPRSRASTT